MHSVLGKTILASRIIDHLIEEKPDATTSFFYCREDDLNESGKCMSLYKSLLKQLVTQNRDLLPVYYEKQLKGPDILNNETTARTLLELCFEVNMSHFIVVDGLDEFGKEDRASAIKFISQIVDKSDTKSNITGKIRVLFVSQDLKDMRKLLPSAEILDIVPEDVEDDIKTFVNQKSKDLADNFELTDVELEKLKRMTIQGARGQ